MLPSLVAVFDTTSQSKLRLSASLTLGWPRFDQMAMHGGTLVTSGTMPTLLVGNASAQLHQRPSIHQRSFGASPAAPHHDLYGDVPIGEDDPTNPTVSLSR